MCPYRSKSAAFGPIDMSGLLIDVTKHISNLKYRVWEKMLDEIDYCKCTESILFRFTVWNERIPQVLVRLCL